jgi:hypothetical protein
VKENPMSDTSGTADDELADVLARIEAKRAALANASRAEADAAAERTRAKRMERLKSEEARLDAQLASLPSNPLPPPPAPATDTGDAPATDTGDAPATDTGDVPDTGDAPATDTKTAKAKKAENQEDDK